MTNVIKPSGKITAKARHKLPDTSELDKSLAYSLRRAQLSTYGNFFSHLDPLEIRPSQFTTLVLIRANPGLTQSAISNAIGIQKANFVTLLDRLEQRGLTERRKVGGDRRSSALYLTPAGKTFVSEMEAAHARMEASLLTRLGKERSIKLRNLLHEFASSAQELDSSIAPQPSAAAKGRPSKPVKTIAATASKAAKRKAATRPAPRPSSHRSARG